MDVWQHSLNHLKNILSKKEFITWIAPLECFIERKIFFICAPNKIFLDWIILKYKSKILLSLSKLFTSDHVVKFVMSCNIIEKTMIHDNVKTMGNFSNIVCDKKDSSTKIFDNVEKEVVVDNVSLMNKLNSFEQTFCPSTKGASSDSSNFGSPIKNCFNFENFVIGKANEVAYDAALQISSKPGFQYNPLFIYGGSGLGKTHLMHAIGNYIISKSPNKKVLYSTSERFVKDYVEAVRLHSIDYFQKFYRSVDILLIDDIQFIAGKSGSQEEFFHTFNALLENSKQVILSCDKYPKEVPKLEKRLISRFGYGLTVTIDIPDLETRSAILLQKSKQLGSILDKKLSLFIASHICSNVRELEGALKRILNYAKFNKQVISDKLVFDCLKDIIRIKEKIVGIDNIQKMVANYYNIDIRVLLSKQKTRDIARPRQIAMTLAKEFTKHSLPEIGDFFGGRDHTTVLHGIRRIRNLLETNVGLYNDYQELSRKLSC